MKKLEKKLNKFVESLIGLEEKPEDLSMLEQMNWYKDHYHAWAVEEVEKMLAHITGSEKQLDWVKSILRSYMSSIYQNGVDYTFWALYYKAAVQASMLHTEASWWIQHRDSLKDTFSHTTEVEEAKEKIQSLDEDDSLIWDYDKEIFETAWEASTTEEKVEEKKATTQEAKKEEKKEEEDIYATFEDILYHIALTGSTKQVAWAEKIRHSAAWKVYKQLTKEQRMQRFVYWLSMHMEASWWIDRRDDMEYIYYTYIDETKND